MARIFDGVSDSLISAANVDLTAYNKLSVACWFWWNSFGTNEADLAILNTTQYILMRPNWSVGSFLCGHSGNVGASLVSFARPSAAAWHHFVMNIDITLAANEVGPVYIDGSVQTLTNQGNADNTTTFSTGLLDLMTDNTVFAAGRVAEFAFWGGGLLSSGDVTALATGAKFPNDPTLSIGAATHYWPLCGFTSPEPPQLGTVPFTVTGAAKTDHPPIISGACAPAFYGTPRFPTTRGVLRRVS